MFSHRLRMIITTTNDKSHVCKIYVDFIEQRNAVLCFEHFLQQYHSLRNEKLTLKND